MGEPIPDCEVVTVEPPEVSPWVTGTSRYWVVKNTADADVLADSILCSGGTFQVQCKWYVSVNRTLYSIEGTVLDVVGSSAAVADGGDTTQLFFALNGSLRVSDLKMSNGAGIHGGANLLHNDLM